METNFEMFEKFNEMYNVEELRSSGSPVEYVDVPLGDYEVAITRLVLGESKKKTPQVQIWFDVVAGEYKGQRIFMYQNVDYGFQFDIVNKFLKGLDTGHEIFFKDFVQYGVLLMEIFASVNGKAEFQLAYGENDKGFNTYEIVKRFDLN